MGVTDTAAEELVLVGVEEHAAVAMDVLIAGRPTTLQGTVRSHINPNRNNRNNRHSHRNLARNEVSPGRGGKN